MPRLLNSTLRTDFGEEAAIAHRVSRSADFATMTDDQMRDGHPVVAVNPLYEVALDLLRLFVLRESESEGEPGDVCINRDAFSPAC